MATVKVYRVTTWTEIPRYWHFATKEAAQTFVREWKAESDKASADIDVVVVPLNAAGIATALDNFITLTCINEG